jgi:hypothetical protein
MAPPACPAWLIGDDADVRPCLLVFALIALASRLNAQAQAPDEGLKVMLFPTIQYAHPDIWTKTPNGRGPVFALANQVVRGQVLHLVVVGGLFATDADKRAEVSYRISSVRPDGSPGAATGSLKFITGTVAGDPRMLRMGAEQSAWMFDGGDPLGAWRLIIEATDAVSGATVRNEQTVNLCGDELLQEALPADIDQGRWLMTYHSRPAPHQLLAALKLIAEHPPAGAKPRRDVENGAWLGFFEQVLADNPWLLPHLVARLGECTGREQELLATSLAYAKRDERAFFETLSGRAREVFMQHRMQNWPVPGAEPTTGVQLDILWGRFFASGRFAPIRELTGLLAYHPFKDAPDEFKKLAEKPAKLPIEVPKGIVFRAVVWSLGSNIQRDKLVRDYCEGILIRKELPEAEHGWLAGIFRSAIENLQKNPPPTPATKGE